MARSILPFALEEHRKVHQVCRIQGRRFEKRAQSPLNRRKKGPWEAVGRLSLPHERRALLQAGQTLCKARVVTSTFGAWRASETDLMICCPSCYSLFPSTKRKSVWPAWNCCSVLSPVSSQRLTPFAFLCSVAQCLLPQVKTAYNSAILGWKSNEDWISTAFTSWI